MAQYEVNNSSIQTLLSWIHSEEVKSFGSHHS